MADTQNTQKEQGYLNLKTIHGLQSSGAIQDVLKRLRDSRHLAERIAKTLSEKKKSLVSEVQKPEIVVEEVKKVVENKPIEDTVKVKEVEREATPVSQSNNNYNQRREFNNNQPRYSEQRTFNNNNNGQSGFRQERPFDKNRPYQPRTDRPQFNRDNRPQGQQGPRPYNNNGQQRPYNPNAPRPFNANGPRPYNNNGPRPFPPKTGSGPNFAYSKGNNFKSFAEPTESAAVLAQPERTFGNKNKNPNKNRDETKQANAFSKKVQSRNTFILEDDDGFSETTMGSRKLIKAKKKDDQVFVAQAVEHIILTAEELTVKLLSEKTGKPVTEIIKKLMLLGVMATINSIIDFDTAEVVCSDFGITIEKKVDKTYEEKLSESLKHDFVHDANAKKRPPVVAVMGHVDHGKTSLLDAIRNTSVVSREAGGITQHIGAYQIVKNGESITFIDTPGHAAFTAMRARGAKSTDIAILVVAADDGIMPQTVEAISHIKSAGVPMIVAINKIDKPEANIDRCKQELAENGVLPEEWGGDAIVVPVSAKTGEGIDKLLSMVLLVAEMQELMANPKQLASGVVLEASLDKNKGPMATVLVQNGTLKLGDNFVCGLTYGKVRAMYDENGKMLKSAGPSTPVSVLGFYGVPDAGDKTVVIDEKFSKKVIGERKDKIKEEKANSTSGVSLDDFMTKVNEGKLKSLNIIVKADVQGSVEALKQTLGAIANEEARVVCIHSGAGAVTESDVLLASASGAIIIAFNVKAQPKAVQMAEQMKIEIKEYNIIYQAVDDLTLAINGMLTPVFEEKPIGSAEVRLVFKLSQAGIVAGSYITTGKAQRNCIAKIFRGNEEIGSTIVESLKILKDDKPEVAKGFECGVKLKESFGVKEGDRLEFFVKEQVKRS